MPSGDTATHRSRLVQVQAAQTRTIVATPPLRAAARGATSRSTRSQVRKSSLAANATATPAATTARSISRTQAFLGEMPGKIVSLERAPGRESKRDSPGRESNRESETPGRESDLESAMRTSGRGGGDRFPGA